MACSAGQPPTETGSPAGEKPVNPYIDTVNRRLRTLRKRLVRADSPCSVGCARPSHSPSDALAAAPAGVAWHAQAKIQANEEAQKAGKALDKDQLASIARKGEVEVLLKELEEIEKQFEAIDAEVRRGRTKRVQRTAPGRGLTGSAAPPLRSHLAPPQQQRNEKKLAKKRRNEELKAMQLARERELERQREVLELVYILRHLSDQEVRQAFLTGAAVATVRRRGAVFRRAARSIAPLMRQRQRCASRVRPCRGVAAR